jgi:hypothetical protein
MPFNVADFNSQISKSGIASTAHFEGRIVRGPRQGLNILRKYGLDNQGMGFRIESLNMPGRTLTALDQQYHGPVRALPYRFTVQPCTITIILSRDLREREVFMRWQDYLVGHSRVNYFGENIPGMFDSKYYDEGVGEIQIWQYSQPTPNNLDRQLVPQKTTNIPFDQTPNSDPSIVMKRPPSYMVQNEIRLLEAYPLSVNDIALSWNDEGYAKLQVEIKYRSAIERNMSYSDVGDFTMNAANLRQQ